jgi:hypothetical protein
VGFSDPERSDRTPFIRPRSKGARERGVNPTFRSLVGGEVTLFIGRSEQKEDLAMQRTEAQDLGDLVSIR